MVCANLRRRLGVERRRGARGFTLLETLIAVAVMAALLALLPRTLLDARTLTNQSHHWLEARLLAESILAEDFASTELSEGIHSGRTYGRDWTVRVVRAASAPPDTRLRLFEIDVTVDVSPGRTLSVETVRLGRVR